MRQRRNELPVGAPAERMIVHVNGMKTAVFVDPISRKRGKFEWPLHGGQGGNARFKDVEIGKDGATYL